MKGSEVEATVLGVLRDLGVRVSAPAGGADLGYDLCLDPGRVCLEVKYRSLIDGGTARAMLAQPVAQDAVLFAVGDRVTKDAREVFKEHGAGYYDLRGHIALWSDTLVFNVDVEPMKTRQQRSDALAGKVGLEVATALLMRPTEAPGVRQLARELGRAPSSISEVLGALKKEGLVGDDLRVPDAQLFWRVAEIWDVPRIHLAATPPIESSSAMRLPLRLGLEADAGVGWALTDSSAAAAYGAPVALRRGQGRDFFVPDGLTLHRAVTLLGTASRSIDATASVRVAPVPAVCSQRVRLDPPEDERWPLAHPLFVALDLAQDSGRGREVLQAWNPGVDWDRVW
ncbi:MAG TPA: transcriptional regulator [Propionibacteriaceae bacterium]|nr:transcriptional regulator [Propionibacteriaceae bacterium]